MDLLDGLTAFKAHHVLVLAVAHLGFEPEGECVYDRGADTVQTAGNLVAVAAELTARMQDGEDDFEGGNAHLGMDADRDTAAVVRNTDDIIGFDGDFDVGTVPGERLVDGVIDDLVDQMMQTAFGGRTDVHAGAFAHGLETLEHLDLTFVIGLGDLKV